MEFSDIEDIIPEITKKWEIISCSRRGDYPAFNMTLIVQAMKNKFIEVVNPRNAKQKTRVSLDPDDVKAWVWWSKNYGPFIEEYHNNRKLFCSYPCHMFNFTINGYDFLEPGVGRSVSLGERLEQLAFLSKEFSPLSIKLRFDPIVHYQKIKDDGSLGPVETNLTSFVSIAEKLGSLGIHEIIIAFCVPYSHVVKRMKNKGLQLYIPTLDEKKKVLDYLIDIGKFYGIEKQWIYIKVESKDEKLSEVDEKLSEVDESFLGTNDYGGIRSCSSDEIVDYRQMIYPNKCVDGDRINLLLSAYRGSAEKVLQLKSLRKDGGQRSECHCTISRDIGNYRIKCPHGCVYCYANPV